jgi:hypothetical protein
VWRKWYSYREKGQGWALSEPTGVRRIVEEFEALKRAISRTE